MPVKAVGDTCCHTKHALEKSEFVLSDMTRLPRPRFGQLAHELYGISREDVAASLAEQEQHGGRLGEILQRRGLITREQIKGIHRAMARWFVSAIDSFAAGPAVPVFPVNVRLSLCLPAYNEEDVIEDTLDSACSILQEFVTDFEIVVANDGSKDRTGEILAKYAETEPRLRVVTNPKNLGYGGALSAALKAAEYELVCFIDSDGQFSLLDLPYLLAQLDNCDVVIGYRKKRADPRIRLFNAWAWSRLVRLVLGVRVRDLDGAFKLFHRETVRGLAMTSRGNCISAEILTQCVASKLKIIEVPVEHFPRYHGKPQGSTPSVVLRAFMELPHLRSYCRNPTLTAPERLSLVKHARWERGEDTTSDNPQFAATPTPEISQIVDTPEQGEWNISGFDIPLTVCMVAACPFPANYGTPGSIRELAEGVAEQGHEVHVVTYHIGDESIAVSGVHLHRIPPLTRKSSVVVGPTLFKPIYDLQMIFKTLEVIKKFKPVVLHAHAYEAALIAWVCSRITGIPVVYSGHHTMADELHTYNFIRPKWIAKLLGNTLDTIVPRLAHRCIPHSPNMERFFEERQLQSRTEPVINFAINVRQLRQGDGVAVRAKYGMSDCPVILYAGLMNQFQRLDLLIAAMRTVVDNFPTAKLLLVTHVASAEFIPSLQKQITELGLSEHVVITDPQPLEAVPDLLAACDVAVVPRPQVPGFPIKLMNYLAAQKPCVLYASSGAHLEHRKNAYLVEKEDGVSLGEGIVAVLGDSELREHIAREGHVYVLKNHDRRAVGNQLCEAYLRAIAPQTMSAQATAAKTGNVHVELDSLSSAENESLVEAVHDAHDVNEHGLVNYSIAGER